MSTQKDDDAPQQDPCLPDVLSDVFSQILVVIPQALIRIPHRRDPNPTMVEAWDNPRTDDTDREIRQRTTIVHRILEELDPTPL